VSVDKVEVLVLDALRGEKGAVLPNVVVRRVCKEHGISTRVVGNAIWRLIDHGELKVTRDSRVELIEEQADGADPKIAAG
jgi:hypothetical protein